MACAPHLIGIVAVALRQSGDSILVKTVGGLPLLMWGAGAAHCECQGAAHGEGSGARAHIRTRRPGLIATCTRETGLLLIWAWQW